MAREIKVALLGDASSLERAFKRASSAGDRVGSRMGLLGRAGSAAGDLLGKGLRLGALGAAGGMIYATKIAGDYQQQLSVFQATANATGKQMKGVGALALKLGADTKLPATSAKDAAVAMTELAKGGLKVKDVMKAAKGTIQLAAAANIDGAAAAALEANTLQAFGLKGSQAAKVADLLAASANATTGSMEDMGFALEHASVGAHALGIPVNDTVAALGEMFNAGIKGGTAGAALNVALTRLSSPTTKAAKALKQMGVDAFTSGGKFVGLGELTKRFSAATVDMTQKQKLSSLATIFGTRGMKAAQIILAGGIDKYNKMKKAVSETGAAQKLSDARTKGFNGAVQGLKSTLETLAITIGTKVLPRASEFLRFLSKVAGASSLSVAIKIAWKGAEEIAADLRKKVSDALFGATQDIGTAHGGVAIGKTFHVDPGFAGKFRTALENVDWSGVGHKIGDALGKAIKIGDDALNKILNSITAWVGSHRGKLADLGAVMLAAIVVKLADPAFWAKHWDLAIGVALALGPAKFGKLGLKVGEMIVKPLGTLGVKIGGRLAEALVGAAENVGPKAALFALRVVLLLEKGLVAGGKLVGKAAQKLGSTIVDKIGAGLNKLGFIAKVLINTAIVQSIAAAAVAAYNEAKKLGRAIIDGVVSGVKSAPGAIKDAITGVVGSGFSAAKGVLGISSPSKKAADELGAPIGQGIILGFLAGTRDLPSKMSTTLRSSLNHAKTAISQARSSFATAFGQFGTDAMTAFDAATAKMVAKIGKRFDKIKANAQDTFDRLGKLADDALGKKLSGIDAAGAQLTPAEQAMKDMQDQRDQKGRSDATSQAAADLSTAQAGVNGVVDPAAVAAAQAAVDSAAFDQRMADLQVQATTERAQRDADTEQQKTYAQNVADQALIARQNYFDAQNAKWDAQQAKQELDLGAERERHKTHLENMLTALERHLEKMPGKWRKAHATLMKMFDEEFGPDFATAGQNLGEAFSGQLKDDLAGTAKTLGDVGTAIIKALGIDTSGGKHGGVKKLAAGGIVTRPTFALIGERGPEAVIPLGGRGGGVGTTQNFYNYTQGIDEATLARKWMWQSRRAVV